MAVPAGRRLGAERYMKHRTQVSRFPGERRSSSPLGKAEFRRVKIERR